MMYTKGPNAPKTARKENVKVRGKALFVNKNSYGIETNSVKKDAIRPNTARSGYSTLSIRNTTSRESSRATRQRASTAMSSHRKTHKPRILSAQVNFKSIANQSTAATESKATINQDFKQKRAFSTCLIRPGDEFKLDNQSK
jgi:hypothetical protein